VQELAHALDDAFGELQALMERGRRHAVGWERGVGVWAGRHMQGAGFVVGERRAAKPGKAPQRAGALTQFTQFR